MDCYLDATVIQKYTTHLGDNTAYMYSTIQARTSNILPSIGQPLIFILPLLLFHHAELQHNNCFAFCYMNVF